MAHQDETASAPDGPDQTPNDVTGEIDIAPTKNILERIDNWIDGFFAMIPNFGIALLIVIAAFIIGAIARKIIRGSAGSRDRENLGEVLGGFSRILIVIFGIMLALTVLAPSLSIGSLISSLGIGSVAIGFAFQDILQNWLAGLLILIRQPFEIGDQIVVTGYEGTVTDIQTRATLIKTYDGQRVVIPNSDIYTSAVLVKTAFELRRSQYDVGVGYSTDIDKACEIAIRELKQCDAVVNDPAPEALPWELDAYSVNIRLRWWTKSDRASVVKVTAQVMTRIKNAYDEAGIDMPYETRVVLFHDQTDEFDGQRGKQFEGWPAPANGKAPRSRRQLEAEARQKGQSKSKGKRESGADKLTSF